LDAVLSDENATAQLKNDAQLTDDQLQKLRDAARNATLQLGEDTSEDNARSTSKAGKDAEKQIQQILGAEKTPQFLSSVRRQLASAGENFSGSVQPSSVPADTRIVVNAPEYRMDAYQDGKLIKTYKVGIGYPEFPLPSGLRRASSIIFNPVWTPPDEPWVKGKFAPGKKVEAGSKDNPLGILKIPIGLPSLIHGGKQPGRLGTFASHGCVGLTNSQVEDFAILLAQLSGTQLTMDDIKGFQKQRDQTKEVKLSNSVPVELRYETIVVEDGKLRIFRDVYERGTNTEDNLRRVLQAFDVNFDSLPGDLRQQILTGLSEMARDAHGNPVDENSNNDDSKSEKAANKTGKVTREAKGKKEVSFDIAELKGKGYPSPVNMMSQ
jgi:lipoprotein-anchoring transpeptidase ErfK/SrfK